MRAFKSNRWAAVATRHGLLSHPRRLRLGAGIASRLVVPCVKVALPTSEHIRSGPPVHGVVGGPWIGSLNAAA